MQSWLPFRKRVIKVVETEQRHRGRQACPVNRAQDVLGKKWTSLIIRDLKEGTRRFGALRKGLGPISTKTLTERLRDLEAHGVVTRTVSPTVPVTVEYALTDKGRALWPVIEAMRAWAEVWT